MKVSLKSLGQYVNEINKKKLKSGRFRSDDPPPGFGLIYPKYYYLEQKRPQPMSPLKVRKQK